MDTPKYKRCKRCHRFVSVGQDNKVESHGPGPNGEFICPGSSDKGVVKAASHLKATD